MKIVSFVLLLTLLVPGKVFCQHKYDVYISNSGNDKNSGTSKFLPKQTFTGTDTLLQHFYKTDKTVTIGLKSGDIFNEALSPAYPVQVSTYFDKPGKTSFAILNGSDEYNSGWAKQNGTSNTYQQSIVYSGFMNQPIGNYSYVYVIEIDKKLEKTAPVTARKPMILAPSLAALDTIPGSFYEPLTTDDPVTVYVHTSNGSSPNSNSKYRYEVSVRYSSFYSYTNINNRFENLWVRGYGAGVGLLPTGDSSYCNNIIFGPGAGIHHIGIKGGTINNALFLQASPNVDAYAVVFYNTYGLGKHNVLSNSMFLDIPYPIYSHTSFPSNFGSLRLDSVIAFAGMRGGTYFANASNTDSVLLNNVYADNYFFGYVNNDAAFNSISNAYLKDMAFGIRYSEQPVISFVNNTFIKAHINGVAMYGNDSLTLSNSIIHLSAPNTTQGTIIIANYTKAANAIKATGNIFISSTGNVRVTMAYTNTDNGIGTTKDVWNNNVYIVLKGDQMIWGITNSATNKGNTMVTSFSEWQRQSGQDKNSLFFDLSNDPRGLKAIFIDPDNGDYELTNTTEANQVKALQAGMTNPISCFLQEPTYEQAVNMTMEHTPLKINSCRSPCLFSNIRVDYKFNSSLLNHEQIELQWNVDEQQNIDHFEIERSIGNSGFTSVHSFSVTANSVYSFFDDHIQLNALYQYRLAIVSKNGDTCYSVIDSIKTISEKHKLSVYPNPSTGKIAVSLNGYTGRGDLTISTAMGQTILSKESSLRNGTSQQVDLSNFAKGVYSLKLQTIDGLYIERFIID